ncbi:pyruvate dehydrogenase complex dihydrolipoamide acetyltransferase [Oceanibacterium hippocampi]|uniref:Acetyltransferase component of pyruvate dehydrogenase complex n=1 Tax=Oceanibacterium hippocampi TaxID=745714 RepID=A0A1Y5T860_9PROT|nr:pyruvate dehydrogenase complex dihydrolipoamide acetyltransferase [Oceanibacterium hippocampi]SLN54570.1 Dihydrolipoyllysine-residue acetyltransferase component of pyruvate dehydrogenase complex [Oceanibacterium hippocampi]
MPITITMPALSPTMTEGTLASWTVKEGATVTSGDVLAEIETDKATMEVEAVDEGRLARILVQAGTENVAVNTPIAVLLEEGEDESALEGYAPEGGPGQTGDGSGKAAEPEAAPEPAKPAEPETAPRAEAKLAPAPKQVAAGSGKDGRIFASPLARRLAGEAGIELAGIDGSGPHGRIVKADVEKAKASPRPASQPAKQAEAGKAPAPAAAQPAAASFGPPSAPHEEITLSNMRKTIARRLTEAKQTVPHFYLTVNCEIDALLALRKQLNAKSDAYKLSVNDFVIRAAALALRDVPDANASWGGDRIYRYKEVDVSVAVAIDEGLITPIVRQADRKGLAEISSSMKDLAERAKAGKLKLEEFQGGSFSISNLGMFGISEFSAVINPPQGAILAIGAGEQRPVVKDGALAVATMMTCTLSCDHRVIDGALGARLLAAFKGFIEDPLTMLL